MATGIYVPIWGLQMTEATVAEWMVEEGEPVRKGRGGVWGTDVGVMVARPARRWTGVRHPATLTRRARGRQVPGWTALHSLPFE